MNKQDLLASHAAIRADMKQVEEEDLRNQYNKISSLAEQAAEHLSSLVGDIPPFEDANMAHLVMSVIASVSVRDAVQQLEIGRAHV